MQREVVLRNLREVWLIEAEGDEEISFSGTWAEYLDAVAKGEDFTEEEAIRILWGTASAGMLTGAAVSSAALSIGTSFTLENPRAVAYLAEHGADLVADINSTTRDYIRTVIRDGVDSGMSYNEMARAISDRYTEFAVGRPQLHIASRAHGIAVTEAGMAYEAGNRIDERVSAECAANEQQGWIPIKKAFASGHQEPLAHPYCRCTALYQRVGAVERPAATVAPFAIAPSPVAPRVLPLAVEPDSIGIDDETEVGEPFGGFETEEKTDEWLTSQAGLNPSLTDDENEALEFYKGDGYQDINYNLRDDSQYVDEEGRVEFMDSALEKTILDYPLVVYRGIDYEVFESENLAGSIIADNAYVSVTLNQAIAEDFAEGINLEIRLPAGAHAINMERWGWGTSSENELLLPRGTKFRVISDMPSEEDPDDRTIILEMIL